MEFNSKLLIAVLSSSVLPMPMSNNTKSMSGNGHPTEVDSFGTGLSGIVNRRSRFIGLADLG